MTFGIIIGYNVDHSHAATEIKQTIVASEPTLEPTPKPTPKPKLVSLGYFELTAYCPCEKCCGKGDGITASGTKATAKRTIAADTRFLPFGTEVYIDGEKYVVEDRGGAVKGKRIDVYFDTHQEALNFGRRQVEIYVNEETY